MIRKTELQKAMRKRFGWSVDKSGNWIKPCRGGCGRTLPATPEYFYLDGHGDVGTGSCRDCKNATKRNDEPQAAEPSQKVMTLTCLPPKVSAESIARAQERVNNLSNALSKTKADRVKLEGVTLNVGGGRVVITFEGVADSVKKKILEALV